MSAALLEQRIDLARPLVLALATSVVTDAASVNWSAAVALRDPVPDALVAGGLETLASVALQMAADLRGEVTLR